MKLEHIRIEDGKVVLEVSGADMLDGTPVYDIKPYIPFADCRPEASEGYTAQTRQHFLTVSDPGHLLERLPEAKRAAAGALLEQDPRPGYSDDAARIYGVMYAGYDIRFRVNGTELIVCEVI